MLVRVFVCVYLFLERGQEGEREGEKHQWLPLLPALSWAGTGNPGMRPDLESIPDLSLCQRTPIPLSHTAQGFFVFLFCFVSI